MATVDSSLTSIRTKVRRLTRSPSVNQITDAEIDSYINTSVLYDFPSHLKLFSLRKTFSFYTSPYIDKYSTNTVLATDPLFDFKNLELASQDPVYIAGYRALFSQSRSEFYGNWPFLDQKVQIGTGDGATTNFTGTLANKPVLQNNVIFTSIGANNSGVVLKDVPVVDAVTGNPTNDGNLYVPNTNPAAAPTVILANNTLNYVTGVYDITFGSAPANGEVIYIQASPYVAARPISVLFFDNSFFVRPIPDQPYEIKIEAYARPTELLTAGQIPELEQWWQYIAFLAARKVLEDRTDFETLAQIMPLLKEQEMLVERRTLTQQGDERAATIYSSQSGLSGGPGNGFFNNNY